MKTQLNLIKILPTSIRGGEKGFSLFLDFKNSGNFTQIQNGKIGGI